VSLNGSDLVSSGKEKQDALIEELKTTLDFMGQQAQLERKSAVADNLNKQLKYFPMKIYIK
jgi:hypothetical protein